MATTVGSFSAVDDTEVDAESPITETLVTRQRDNAYWIDAGTKKTTVTDTTKVLKPDGSGGVAWSANDAIDGTKGVGSMPTTSGAPLVVSIQTASIFDMTVDVASSSVTPRIIIDSADDSFVHLFNGSNASGTLTGSFVELIASSGFYARKNGTDYELYYTVGGSYMFIWL